MDGRTAAAVLGITQGATRDEIRRAFRARAKLAHPDAHGTDEAFVTLRAAADLLLATAPETRGRRLVARDSEARSDPILHTAAAAGSPATTTSAATIAAAAGTPSGPIDGAVGRRAARWVQQPSARPGAAIDLTDRPAGIGRHRASAAGRGDRAAAFARVLEAELARR